MFVRVKQGQLNMPLCPRVQLLFVFRFLASALAPAAPSVSSSPSSLSSSGPHASSHIAGTSRSEEFLLAAARCLYAAAVGLRTCGQCPGCLQGNTHRPAEAGGPKGRINGSPQSDTKPTSHQLVTIPPPANGRKDRNGSGRDNGSYGSASSAVSSPASSRICALSFLRSEPAAPLLGQLLAGLIQRAEGEQRRGQRGSRELRLLCLQSLRKLIVQVG